MVKTEMKQQNGTAMKRKLRRVAFNSTAARHELEITLDSRPTTSSGNVAGNRSNVKLVYWCDFRESLKERLAFFLFFVKERSRESLNMSYRP